MRKIAAMFLILILFNCNSDDLGSVSETDMNIVTGINIRNSEFSTPIQLGNPNVYIDANQMIIYPNPASSVFRVQSFSTITDVWIVSANAKKAFQKTNFDNILNPNIYTESEIDFNSELKFLNQNTLSLSINLESLNSGYYRVFVKIDGDVFWDNIYVPNDNFEIDDLINFWN